ncbi:MAG: hypothetical protein WBI82_13205 [Sphaerochaeta sp.]
MPPFPPPGALYLTWLSPPSLGNGIMVMLVLLSLRWGMRGSYHGYTCSLSWYLAYRIFLYFV